MVVRPAARCGRFDSTLITLRTGNHLSKTLVRRAEERLCTVEIGTSCRSPMRKRDKG